ncbi:hypothetical protein O3P69_005271 [Scylla paramamosain]|uniref:Sulfotransferase domain-containing protein n=1 Tax=Scylla paramamosain TaxID=85552 RepID=A0AAW0U7I9_SCYPA
MIHNNNFDNPKAGTPIWMRSQSLSLDMMFDLNIMDSAALDAYYKAFDKLCPGKKREDGVCLQLAEMTPTPRVLKNNFPLSLQAPNLLDRAKIARYTSFSAMKSRGEPVEDKIFKKTYEEEVMFYRKGMVGDWKKYFSPELQEMVDQWIQKNLNDSDLSPVWCLGSAMSLLS